MNNPDNKQTTEVATLQTINHPGQIDRVANQIRAHVSARKLTANIQGKQYPMVEAWQYAGALLGLFPRVVACDDVSKNGEHRFRAEVEVIDSRSGDVVSRAFAFCSNKENRKRTFDEYAVASMAQTRAVGKAFRVLLAWILQASGYEATPAEEMDGVADDLLLAEYKISMLKALDLCRSAEDVTALMEDAESVKHEPDVRNKAAKIFKQFKSNQNGK